MCDNMMSQSATSAPAAAKPVLEKTGVMLINLGTPDGTDFTSMRRYLREFLMDKRVIEWPKAIWYPVLFGIVLNTRPKKSGAAYARIWNHEQNESPLRTYTRSQSEQLGAGLSAFGNVVVDWAMRYGKPSIEDVLTRLREQGCTRIVAFPLYPQYSSSTTGSVNEKLNDALNKLRFMPAIRTIPSYQNDPVYIDALACSIEEHLVQLDFEPQIFVASYHGIPQSYARRGDPYYEQCLETTRLLRERLGLDEKRMISAFQSRFGPEEWLQPYTDKTIEDMPKQGIKSVAVFNPGFVADCLETVDEIGNEAAEAFHENGGENFTHIPCLNDTAHGMRVIEHLVRRELQGWV
ncbi:ferrochelatase [Pseudochrobactrum sp. HB0163]|uniref:ferrochelatase n=1 Tax=Pseudochrobactrum sp. HB0163 TaxID=3450708 RepID=UPI003F6E36BB